GELSETQLDAIADHLEGCPQCEAAARQLDGVLDPALALLRRPEEGAETLDGAPAPRPAPGPAAAALPDPIRGYEIQGELGGGGMGVVYGAWQAPLGGVVALKMMLGGRFADPEHRARFGREAEAIARLRHPHIVQIFDIGEHDGQPFFTLEYLEGG